ncbi:unnamed protein product [Amoebophrya sp. A25]|nr:unnamed protein product [Amoebophrya sp. A25]|eukprot:GSA25T00014452001.1
MKTAKVITGDLVWQRAAALLAECECILITAGASMGKDCGLSTFAECDI